MAFYPLHLRTRKSPTVTPVLLILIVSPLGEMQCRKELKGRSLDAAQDELAFNLALLHRVLVLARHLWHLLGGVGVGPIDGLV